MESEAVTGPQRVVGLMGSQSAANGTAGTRRGAWHGARESVPWGVILSPFFWIPRPPGPGRKAAHGKGKFSDLTV